ncbi:Protein of unknown function [Friedmanniella luteola]|uniref:DUF3710 domain-containing protein n=1 Tax=Friedmanniella luteola TaxID=546871 RepID=A0A1H1S1Q7_9ACTN|nr:DUF3710 domain-containing protein [Friedmanniella luteola]SDS41892.1 Protein of unknown function [Friedmanniella luteola]
MIFRRTKKRSDEPELDDTATPETTDDLDAGDAPGPDAEGTPDGEVELDLDALDAADWRAQGPFDIAELDEDDDLAGTPEMPRIDLGAMVLAGFPGAELRLQMSEETQQIVSAMLVLGDSALELGAYAAPRSGGLWSELREEIAAAATEAGGSASLAEGPFGVELRRLIPVSTPEGEQGYQPSRMWVAEGPRWLLRGIVYGQAALEDGLGSPVAEMLTAFRSVVVRRGDEAMAPGDLLPLSMPQNLVAADEPPA